MSDDVELTCGEIHLRRLGCREVSWRVPSVSFTLRIVEAREDYREFPPGRSIRGLAQPFRQPTGDLVWGSKRTHRAFFLRVSIMEVNQRIDPFRGTRGAHVRAFPRPRYAVGFFVFDWRSAP